jgi:hypothetical protein
MFREIWTKKNLEFVGDNLLRYIPVTTLVFSPEFSNGTEDDEVTFLNVPAIVSERKLLEKRNILYYVFV